MVMQQVKKIKQLVEHCLAIKIDSDPDPNDLLQVEIPTAQDTLVLIKYYINNQHLVTQQFIADLVRSQLDQNKLRVSVDLLPKSNNWQEYVQKLENLLEQVRYRRANNFEYDQIMPTQQQLHELQHECLQLTEQWYGEGKSNLSCFYLYFIAMSQEAYVTSFKYDQIDTYVSNDGYISQVNAEQRRAFYLQHEETFYHDFVRQGGRWLRGRSEIDATSMSNIFYYKNAQLLLNYGFAKQMVVAALGLENYGQLPYAQRLALWHLLQQNFPEHSALDKDNIFYKFTEYINAVPGEFFNYFSVELPEASQASPQMLFDIIKIAGIQSKYLILFSRSIVDNWPPKRYLSLQWGRINGEQESSRIWPNEIPYVPGHGLSLCGNGLLEGKESYGSIAYEWNTPLNSTAEKDNYTRDIEKIFKEFYLLCPKVKENNLLTGEQLLSIFQNTIAYSTILTTQHMHIESCTIDSYPIYMLQADSEFAIPEFGARLQLVKVGSEADAYFLKVLFTDLDNAALLNFLLQMNSEFLDEFGGLDKVDCYIHLFSTDSGEFVFIYEPHAHLVELEPNKFLNPDNNSITPRRPLLLRSPNGKLSGLTNNMAVGLDFLRSFFDQTCKRGTNKWITEYITRYVTTHQ